MYQSNTDDNFSFRANRMYQYAAELGIIYTPSNGLQTMHATGMAFALTRYSGGNG